MRFGALDGNRRALPVAPEVRVVGSRPAGDSFDASFLAGVLAGGSVQSAMAAGPGLSRRSSAIGARPFRAMRYRGLRRMVMPCRESEEYL